MAKRFPKSVRKYLRREKARIRGQFLDSQIREEKIKELLQKTKSGARISKSTEKGEKK
ncbi:MAG: hypothetical protein Q8Q97_01905 [bacterium]|nr:hypothetical protein [bacterium]